MYYKLSSDGSPGNGIDAVWKYDSVYTYCAALKAQIRKLIAFFDQALEQGLKRPENIDGLICAELPSVLCWNPISIWSRSGRPGPEGIDSYTLLSLT